METLSTAVTSHIAHEMGRRKFLEPMEAARSRALGWEQGQALNPSCGHSAGSVSSSILSRFVFIVAETNAYTNGHIIRFPMLLKLARQLRSPAKAKRRRSAGFPQSSLHPLIPLILDTDQGNLELCFLQAC